MVFVAAVLIVLPALGVVGTFLHGVPYVGLATAYVPGYLPQPGRCGGDDGVMADDDLDVLYAAKPEDFTALRTKLAAEAKKRGDADTAKQITAARRPTTAAHVVNLLVLNDASARGRLTDLGERLRAAHAGMDGSQIRELTAQQRRLIDELARAAFEEADLRPTAALRDDVTATLQAAIADPEVAARLGRLAKAEQWSGFGEFGDTTIVFKPTRGRKTAAEPEPAKPAKDDPAEKSPATTNRPRNVAGDKRRGRHWPPPSAPRRRPTTRSTNCRPTSRRPGCGATTRTGGCRTPKVRSRQPKTPTNRRSRPAATPRPW